MRTCTSGTQTRTRTNYTLVNGVCTSFTESETQTCTVLPPSPCPAGESPTYGNICTASDVANDWFGWGCASVGQGVCSIVGGTGSSCVAYCLPNGVV